MHCWSTLKHIYILHLDQAIYDDRLNNLHERIMEFNGVVFAQRSTYLIINDAAYSNHSFVEQCFLARGELSGWLANQDVRRKKKLNL